MIVIHGRVARLKEFIEHSRSRAPWCYTLPDIKALSPSLLLVPILALAFVVAQDDSYSPSCSLPPKRLMLHPE